MPRRGTAGFLLTAQLIWPYQPHRFIILTLTVSSKARSVLCWRKDNLYGIASLFSPPGILYILKLSLQNPSETQGILFFTVLL